MLDVWWSGVGGKWGLWGSFLWSNSNCWCVADFHVEGVDFCFGLGVLRCWCGGVVEEVFWGVVVVVVDVFTMRSEVGMFAGSCEPEVIPGIVKEYHRVGTVAVFCKC
jgi:hypothetical protein